MSALIVPARTYIRRETRVSMAINAVISLAFYLLVFGRSDPVPVWGIGEWVFDFVPQGFMVALMSTVVPGALATRKLAAGTVEPFAGAALLPRSLALRALLLATVSATAGTAIIAAIIWLAGANTLANISAGAIKVGYGALLAALITPVGMAAALSTR